ncbi:polymorphic toxin-type HINT domain-containing protein, partial [Streptomyces sp. AK02-04a]|uniref:polymorphic toxin-type HINT domain-containing protein n=1 Tax=Streptomyces sp. AK02-04a TaxID=3028649 RepID=UPI0029B7DA5C
SAADAAQAASGAGSDANDAADAADQANSYADQAGAHSAEAQNAAAAAHRHAREAGRAADAAQALAQEAASAAGEARDAANDAATHAENAAKAADDAAKHAGEAATAAKQSAAHAKEAKKDADAASAAVAKAQKVHDLAVRIDTAQLTARTNEAIARARDLKAQEDQQNAAQQAAVQQAKDLQAEAAKLADQASQPGADTAKIASEARKVALATAKTGRAWSQSAALVALAGTDTDATAYIRTNRKEASGQDDRQDVEHLATHAGSADVRTAASKALEGDAAAVTAFLTTGQYEAMKQDMRLYIARTIATAGPIEQQAGRTALDSDTPDALRQFIASGDPQARTQDERVRAAQLADNNSSSNGPQVKAAARIALEGPSGLLHAFITVGQYKAQRQDRLAATHEAQIQQLIAQAAGVAATAQKNAAEAGKTAATAAKAAAEAAGYAKQADQSAKDAQKYATQADGYATQAEQSAKDAAASAKTARTAQQDAENAAAAAVTSAAQAQYSATAARGSADSAWTDAQQARASATAAGKDATAANQAATEAYHTAVTKQQQEQARWRQWYEEQNQKSHQNDDGSWIPGWLKDTVNTIGDYGSAILDNGTQIFGGLVETFAGVGSVGFGASGDLAGGAVCLTGIGCLAGAPAIVASTLLIIGGVYGIGDGISRFSDGLGKALREAEQEERGGAEETCSQCFVAGTKVLMTGGSTKNIEDVRAGDKVVATNPLTRKSEPHRVTRLIVTDGDKHFDELTIATPGGPQKLTATYEHPFWNPSENRWVKARDLRPGSTLLSSDGSTVRVQANRGFDQRVRTYNLTVEDFHTYYVLAGSTPILVHNAGCDEFAAKLQKKMGGEIWTITPKHGLNSLGDYKLASESWGHHTFVVKDGRVYDQFTGPDGMSIDEWKAEWSYPEDHEWTLVSPNP